MFYENANPQLGVTEKAMQIGDIAYRLFGWQQRARDHFLLHSDLQKLNDDEQDLNRAITENVRPGDRVLTIPSHLPFYAKLSFDNVVVYDISPIQLDSVDGQVIKRYWCDVFHPGLFANLLTQVNPVVIDLSNIPEYASDDASYRGDEIPAMASVIHKQKSLEKVVFSSFIYDRAGMYSNAFSLVLKSLGWSLKEYQGTTYLKSQKIFVASRE